MASQIVLVLGVLLATVLLISTEAAARELAEQPPEKEANEAGVEEQKYHRGGYGGHPGGGYGGYPGGGYGGYPGGGYRGYPGGGYPRGGYGGYRGGGYGGYPGGGYRGGGYPGRGYPGGGYRGRGYGGYPGRGRCYYGCCRRGYYGGCQCCTTANEMPDSEYMAEPHY